MADAQQLTRRQHKAQLQKAQLQKAQQQKAQRFDTIQVLRFVAALLVVVTHATFYASTRLDDGQPIWRLGGTVGVEIFFVISGFVMVLSTGSLRDRADGWKFFAMRRLVRIVPMYWLATTCKVAVVLVASGVALHGALEPGHVLSSYLFVPSRNEAGAVEPLLGVGWTLVFEMFFYLVFTIALALRVDVIRLCGAVLVLCAFGVLLRPGQDWPVLLYYLNPIVLNFLVGMVIAAWVRSRDNRQLTLRLGLIVAVWTILAFPMAPEGAWFDWTQHVRHLGITALMLAVVVWNGPLSRRLPASLIWLGDASYSLYLFHPLMAPAIPAVLAKLGLVSAPLSILLTVVGMPIAAAIIYRFAERPITRWLQARLPYVKVHPPGRVEQRA